MWYCGYAAGTTGCVFDETRLIPNAPRRERKKRHSCGGMWEAGMVGGALDLDNRMPKATEQTLLPGTSVSVQLVRGDYSIAASGTVTFRDGDRQVRARNIDTRYWVEQS